MSLQAGSSGAAGLHLGEKEHFPLARHDIEVTLITRTPKAAQPADIHPSVELKFVPYRTFPLAGRRGTTVIDRSTAYPLFGARAGAVAADLARHLEVWLQPDFEPDAPPRTIALDPGLAGGPLVAGVVASLLAQSIRIEFRSGGMGRLSRSSPAPRAEATHAEIRTVFENHSDFDINHRSQSTCGLPSRDCVPTYHAIIQSDLRSENNIRFSDDAIPAVDNEPLPPEKIGG